MELAEMQKVKRQGKSKVETDGSLNNENDKIIIEFKLNKGVHSETVNTNEKEKGTNEKEKEAKENDDDPKDLITNTFLLDKGEVENDSKESKTTSENVGNSKERDVKHTDVPLALDDLSSGADSDDQDSDKFKDATEHENNLLSMSMDSSRKKRLSVSAEAYGEWNKKKDDFVPKVYEKDDAEKKKIREAINESFLFCRLNDKEIETIVDAFFGKKVEKGCHIIDEGDDGDLLYVIDEGEVEIYRKKKGEEVDGNVNGVEDQKEVLTLLKPKDVFGELALLYNSKRAATAEALTDCSLWALDRESFNYIIKDTVAKNRKMYEEILQQVYVLKDMDPYERSKLADCLKSETYKDGEIIIKEGEQGDTFYMLVDGHAVATKNNTVIKDYNKGDYFGELALLKNQPRAATVTCKGSCRVVYLDRKSFKRLLGPVEMILNRNVENYKQVLKQLGLDTTCIEAN